MFLEYDVDDNAFYSREGRWWAAYGAGSVILPLVMVDSGNQISNGSEDFYTVYKGMVHAALARPALAEIEAYRWRAGDKVTFSAQVTNRSGVTLSGGNAATVHAIVYEETQVAITGRYVRAVASTGISSLAPDATATFELETSELVDVDWDKLRYLVLVDYRPAGSSGPYDMLQAAFAQSPTSFAVQPETLSFWVDPADPVPQAVPVMFESAETMNWTTLSSASWLTVTPASGSTTIQPLVSLITEALSPGWQSGVLTFTATDGTAADQVAVTAFYGTVQWVYLPLTIK